MIRSILYDLGGVLMDFRGLHELEKLRPDLEPREVQALWLSCEAVKGFERGSLDASAFAHDAPRELGLELTPAQFLEAFRGWLGGPLPGARELLGIRPEGTLLAVLSNTNSVHAQQIHDFLDPHGVDRLFLSFEHGWVKPDAEAFEAVCQDLGLEPSEILFFDDSWPNVEAARELGLRSELVRGPNDCRRLLDL